MSYQSSKATLYDISGNPITTIGADNSTNSTTKLPVLVGRANTSAPTWTDGYMVPLSTDLSGSLRVTATVSSGTITANQGTSPWVSNITQFGSNNVVTGTGASGVGIPRVTVSNDSNVLATQSGTWTVQPGNTANTTPWLATINQGGNSATVTASNALKVDGSAVTQPVSGTVTANIGTTNGLALDATLAKLTITQGTALGTNTQAMVGGSVTTAAPTYTTGQISPISLTTAGAIRIDGSGVTQPVSGTVTANAGTGNFTVVQATAANLRAQTASESTTAAATGTVAAMVGGAVTTAAPTYTTGQMDPLSLTTAGALRIDGSGVTQPVSGTVTANIGTTNGLALDATLAKLTITQGTALGTNTQAMVGGSVTTAAPTYTTGQISPLSLTTAGALRIDGSAVTQPVSGTVTSNQGTAASLANAWSTKITDATNGPVAVKAASTAAVATDPAFVVAISPNNTISVGPVTVSQSDTTGTGTLNALNTTASVALAGTYGAAMQLVAGTLVGTIVPEVSVDGGTTWVATYFDDSTTGNKVSSIVFGSSNTATTRSIMSMNGASNVRVRVSAFTSGTATCNIRATTQDDATTFYDGAAGSALAPTVAQVGGSVTTAAPTYTNATMNALSLTTTGLLRIDGSGVTQPVSGTVTANQGTANTLANAWSTKITDATNGPVAVKGASTVPTASDPALVVSISPNSDPTKIWDGTNTVAVKAASTAAAAADVALVVSLSPNSHVKGTVEPLYGSNNQTITITLASLTNTSARASTAVNNTTNLYEDALIFVKITTAAAAVSATGYVNVYGYGSVDGGTTYPEAITGTDAAVTLTTPPNLVILAQINANTNGATKTFGPFSFCRQYGVDRLPDHWGVVVVNQTGATFNATAGNHAVIYQGVNGQLV